MNVLSLDQATKITGYAYFIDSKLIKHGKFISKKTPAITRIKEMITQIENFIKNNKVDVLVFEDIQLEENEETSIPTFKILSKLQGAIELLALNYNIKYIIKPPITWRTNLRIDTFKKNREYLKAQSLIYVQNNFKLDVSVDEAEAICIGQSYVIEQQVNNRTLAWGHN